MPVQCRPADCLPTGAGLATVVVQETPGISPEEPPMLHAESRGRARGRALTLFLAALLAGLFGLLSISAAAQDKGGPEKKSDKKAEKKGDKRGAAEKEVPWPR